MSFIPYAPEYVFPRNPNIAQFIKPQNVKDEVYGDNGLSFSFGRGGMLNTIKTKYTPYINRANYNFSTKTWNKDTAPITISIDDRTLTDITPYFTNSVMNFSSEAKGINDEITYYFDGAKIITNFNFSNTEHKNKVKISYTKLLNSVRVKATLLSNKQGISHYTPVIDQYTLIIDKQKVLN